MPAIADPFGFPNDPYPRPYGDKWNFPSGPFSGYDWLGLAFLENAPQAAYQRHLSRYPGGQDFTSPFFSFAQAQQPEYYKDYISTAARPNNMGLTWRGLGGWGTHGVDFRLVSGENHLDGPHGQLLYSTHDRRPRCPVASLSSQAVT